jgi:hypothetical protein
LVSVVLPNGRRPVTDCPPRGGFRPSGLMTVEMDAFTASSLVDRFSPTRELGRTA